MAPGGLPPGARPCTHTHTQRAAQGVCVRARACEVDTQTVLRVLRVLRMLHPLWHGFRRAHRRVGVAVVASAS